MEPHAPGKTLPSSPVTALLAFAGRLRADGFAISPSQVSDCLRAMELAGLASRGRLRAAMEHVFVFKQKDLQKFRRHFEEFWRMEPWPAQDDDPFLALDLEGPKEARSVQSMHENASEEADREIIGAGLEVVKASVDFSKLQFDDLEQVREQVSRMARKLGKRLSRRQVNRKRAYRLDIRRSVRRGLQHGGELIMPVFSKRREGRLQIYALVDVSGSMAVYGYFFCSSCTACRKSGPPPIRLFSAPT